MLNLKSVSTAALSVIVANGCLADGYSEMIISLGPVSYWRLGETSGTTAVDEMGVENAMYHAPTLGGEGAITGNASPSFNGSSNYVEVLHNDAYLLDEGAVSLWFKADLVHSRQELFSKDSKNYDTGGHLTIMLKNSHVEVRIQSVDTSYWLIASDCTITEWNHVLLTFGPAGVQLYVNGQLEDTDSYTGGLGTSSGGIGNYEPIAIGANTWTSNDLSQFPMIDYFDGHLDEVAIFGFQLTPTQITNLSSPTGGDAGVQIVEWNALPPINSN